MKPGHAGVHPFAVCVTPSQLGPARAGSGESDTNEETLPPTTHTTWLLGGARFCAVHSHVLHCPRRKRLSASACHVSILLRKGALRRLAFQRCLSGSSKDRAPAGAGKILATRRNLRRVYFTGAGSSSPLRQPPLPFTPPTSGARQPGEHLLFLLPLVLNNYLHQPPLAVFQLNSNQLSSSRNKE